MNIEKLARHLKEFTLDEINMIAEFDCKTELEHLLNANKISFEQGVYKYIKEVDIACDYGIFIFDNKNIQNLRFKNAVANFLNNYAQKNCTKETYRNYCGHFRQNILPYFKNRILNTITINDIKLFYKCCLTRNLKPRRLKNTMSLLNQLIRYYKNLGIIDCNCNFQVRRLTSKNEFSMNRIIFKGE